MRRVRVVGAHTDVGSQLMKSSFGGLVTGTGTSGRVLRPLRRAAFSAMLLLALVVALVALFMWLNDMAMQAVAVLLGGAISLLPNFWFALRVLVWPAPLSAPQRISSLYKAEAIKLLLATTMFMLVFVAWRSVPPATVLVAFVLAHALYLLLQAWLLTRLQAGGDTGTLADAHIDTRFNNK